MEDMFEMNDMEIEDMDDTELNDLKNNFENKIAYDYLKTRSECLINKLFELKKNICCQIDIRVSRILEDIDEVMMLQDLLEDTVEEIKEVKKKYKIIIDLLTLDNLKGE